MDLGSVTAAGALGHYVSGYNGSDFQPMNVTYGIMDGLDKRIRNKKERYEAISQRALAHIDELISKGVI